ncbi:MAG: hypothetical protein QM750_09400 [Rubrivivax sp.]
MRILLDESLPHDLAPLIRGHAASTVRDIGPLLPELLQLLNHLLPKTLRKLGA